MKTTRTIVSPTVNKNNIYCSETRLNNNNRNIKGWSTADKPKAKSNVSSVDPLSEGNMNHVPFIDS